MQLQLVLFAAPTIFLGLNLQGCGSAARPSTVPYCPDNYVDCGTCLCVPKSTCEWCPGAKSSSFLAVAPTTNISVANVKDLAAPLEMESSSFLAVAQANSSAGQNSVTSPSSIYGCPESYVDCGTCLCVPESTCEWCPSGQPVEVPAEVTKPSTIWGCPESYVDCGTCLCVPESTCQWCPAGSAHHEPPVSSNSSRPSPSAIVGCPESYVDCGACLCVPESTCQWCPGLP